MVMDKHSLTKKKLIALTAIACIGISVFSIGGVAAYATPDTSSSSQVNAEQAVKDTSKQDNSASSTQTTPPLVRQSDNYF